MQSFYLWPGRTPKKCGNCNKRLKRTLMFSDTTDGRRNIAMCEDCFSKIGEERATYGAAREYVQIKGMWISGSQPDWNPEEIPDGITLNITDPLSQNTKTLTFTKSMLG